MDMQYIQNSALGLILFDDEHSALVVDSVPLDNWVGDGAFAEFIAKVYEYIGVYNHAPKDALPLLIDNLKIKKEKLPILHLMATEAESRYVKMNIEYVVQLLRNFGRLARVKTVSTQAAELANAGRLDEADELLCDYGKAQTIKPVQRGTSLLETAQRLLMHNNQMVFSDRVKFQIAPLDVRDIALRRGTLFTYLGGAKAKKTWFLIHTGTCALIEGKRVLHITLEVNADIVNTRYFQCFRSLVTNKIANKSIIEINPNIDIRSMIRPSLEDDDTIGDVIHWLKNDSHVNAYLHTVQFPMSQLTFKNFVRYVDDLDRREGFQPDVIIIDYVPLMKVVGNDRREGLGTLVQEIRGFATERNAMLVTVWQAKREAIEAKRRLEMTDVAEDYTIAHNSDVLLSGTPQTDLEEKLGLMRLYVAAARNQQQKFEMLVTQNIPAGQFCLKAHELTPVLAETLKSYYESEIKAGRG